VNAKNPPSPAPAMFAIFAIFAKFAKFEIAPHRQPHLILTTDALCSQVHRLAKPLSLRIGPGTLWAGWDAGPVPSPDFDGRGG
jgi:hypothetical protein